MQKNKKVGNIYKISISESTHTYGRQIDNYIFTFFDLFVDTELSKDEIVSAKPLFSLGVHKDVFKKSRWELIGNIPLTDSEIANPPLFFKQDIGNASLCWIVNTKGEEKKVSPDLCIGLERLASWDYQQVEGRLRDVFLKRENKFAKSMEVTIPSYGSSEIVLNVL